MLTKLLPLVLITALAPSISRAASCTDIKSCAKVVGDLTGKVYIWSADAEPVKFFSSEALEFNQDNADLLFTALLDQNILVRMPVGDGKTYRIMKSQMIKELEVPVVEASADRAPTLPKTWDWVTMRYKLKSPEMASVIESAYRLHVPREGRMQADNNSGFLLVTGTAPMVRQMYETIRAADKPLKPATREEMKRQEKMEQERMNAAAGSSKKSE